MFKRIVLGISMFVLVIAAHDSVRGQESAAPPTNAKPPAAAKTEKAKVYDESADAKKQIADALARAKNENRRVLIQWGGNWCSWCIKLHNLYKSNQEIAKELAYEYDVVYIDTGRPEGKNIDLAKSYGFISGGLPYLTVLDDSGKVIANQETGSFENKDQEAKPGHDPEKVLAFLTQHHATPIDAQQAFNDALAKAKAENKRVFLHFGAPWCGWCKRLDAWLDRDDVKTLLAKDFIADRFIEPGTVRSGFA